MLMLKGCYTVERGVWSLFCSSVQCSCVLFVSAVTVGRCRVTGRIICGMKQYVDMCNPQS